jgi:hypothetical protein
VPTIALHAEDHRLVAYVLVAGRDTIAAGGVVRDCRILAVPTDASLLDQPLMAALEPWYDDERTAQVVRRAGTATLHIALSVEDRLVLDVDDDLSGRWRLDPDLLATGFCRAAAL